MSTIIAVLLLLVASLLAFEALFPPGQFAALPQDPLIEVPVAVGTGLLVGAISSMLGVAGGEFIIPILIFGFGADIKTAGTASVLISTPLVLTGIVRHTLGGKYRSKTMLARLALPMSAGSILGAVLGAYAANWTPSDTLKVVLAAILAGSAVKLVRSH